MEYVFMFFVAAVLLPMAGLVAYSFYKIRRIDKNVSEILFRVVKLQQTDLVQVFQQRQNLDMLQHELTLTRPLPPTRGWAASPDFLLLISRHARAAQPDVIVECSSGASTVVLASCLREAGRGHVYSLENEAEFAEMTRGHLAREGLSDWATVIHAPLKPYDIEGGRFFWYDDQELPEAAIDMIVIDGPPHLVGRMARYPAGPRLFTRLAAGGTVFADDADRSEEEATLAAWRKQFPDFAESYHHCEKGCISFRKA